jgi:hypothetical protein
MKKVFAWTKMNVLKWSSLKLCSVWNLCFNYFLSHLLFMCSYWVHSFLIVWRCASMRMIRSWLYSDELYRNVLSHILSIEDIFLACVTFAFGVSCIESWGVSDILANIAVAIHRLNVCWGFWKPYIDHTVDGEWDAKDLIGTEEWGAKKFSDHVIGKE